MRRDYGRSLGGLRLCCFRRSFSFFFLVLYFFPFLFKEKRIVHNKEEEQQENVQELGDLWLFCPFFLLILYDWHVCIIGEAGPLQFHIPEKKRGERLYGSKQADTTAAIAAAPLHDSGGDGWTGGLKKKK